MLDARYEKIRVGEKVISQAILVTIGFTVEGKREILDWRVAEFGYGGLDPFGTYSHNYPIKQVSMGFVIHLP